MKNILVTGGTVFVSRYIVEYYVSMGWNVYVLNRNSRKQAQGVKLIQGDRHELGNRLKGYHFDVVIDTGYTAKDVETLLDALGTFEKYIFISSSAVYPEYCSQPFTEESTLGENKYWGKYGTDKIAAEEVLRKRVSCSYILRPPYLYGPMNNVYREAFVFECALENRRFYLPKDGEMKLQFFHVNDLCRMIDRILEQNPREHIFNVGNKNSVSVREWVTLCYQAAGKVPEFINVAADIEQRKYFSFYDYDYYLDVSKQYKLMPDTKPLEDGLRESFEWYQRNAGEVRRKPLIAFIDENLKGE